MESHFASHGKRSGSDCIGEGPHRTLPDEDSRVEGSHVRFHAIGE